MDFSQQRSSLCNLTFRSLTFQQPNPQSDKGQRQQDQCELGGQQAETDQSRRKQNYGQLSL